ncbi:cilium assembly protein DZIP1L isoform X2 [Neocloeon triangulifer]|uniref:cilium assembly protein DZIP1L isoform X2 n=1 Tax=Neocloeon triangulifer TaxID=2078957 RepID=UPI00286F0D88|nr:cilium assembly protein DZIP1L isoform X2 [Neocloeon triangulifer]
MSTHFSSRLTNFEFVKGVKDSGFTFKSYKEKADLTRIAHLDLDRVARDLDISVLQEYVGTLVNCDLSDLKGVDPGLSKLLHLAQLCVDYCLYCQDFLANSLSALENVHEEVLKELQAAKKENRSLKDKLKKETKRKRLLTEQKENKILDSFYECSQCRKVYSSQEFLQSHIQRRHSIEIETADKSKEMLQELKAEIESLRRDLVKEKEAALTSFQDNKSELYLKREEALWAEIEKSQAEQRARHQAEIADLTANFQLQLKQSLADLATNLSKSDLNIENIPKMQTSNALQVKIQDIKEEMNDLWQKKLDQQEHWFRSENSKVMDQLIKMQEREDLRWSEIRKIQNEPKTLPIERPQTFDAPVPAARHKKLQRQMTTTVSKLEFKAPTPSAPLLSDQIFDESTAEETEESSAAQETSQQKPQNFVLCTPKTVPSRPKSATGAYNQETMESTSGSEEETTDKSDDIDATLKEMKEAIQQNPVLIESLKNEVETQVQEKFNSVGLLSDEGLNRKEFLSVSNQMKEQRKDSEKQFSGFWKIRKSIEKKVEIKAKENMAEICNDSNVKPSKLKQHPGFFAKLTKRYNKKGNKSKSDTQIFTSTPVKKGAESPGASILKAKSNLRASSEVLNEKKANEQRSTNTDMRRAQSLPSSKFVTFDEEEDENKENNTWDEDTLSKATMSETKIEVKKIGQGNFNPFITSSSITKSSEKPELDLDELEKEIDFNLKNTFKIGESNRANSKIAKADLSLPVSDDNSWDLEDI